MENATKALIIAAAILIAIVLISLGVFVLGQGTNLVQENSDLTPTEVMMFNSKFEAYCGDNVSGTKVKQLEKFIEQYTRTAAADRPVTLTKQPEDLTISAGEVYKVTPIPGSSGLIKEIKISK